MADDEEPFPLLPITSTATINKCASLPLKRGDVFVASFPKSGTTWMQHIVHTLATNGDSPLPHVSDACPFFEVDRTWSTTSPDPLLADSVRANHAKIAPVRIFNTHLRWAMMPKGSDDARYVYMTRRAVDACVSFYHHLSHQAPEDGGFDGTLGEFIDEWTGGRMFFGSWSAHLKSWLTAAESDKRILIVPYEGLKADPSTWVRKVSKHCGFGLSDERIDELLPRFTFEWMRANEQQFEPRSVRWVQKPLGGGGDQNADGEFHFIRAGRVGDGDKPFATPSEAAKLTSMVERTFGSSEGGSFVIPSRVAKLLPGGDESDEDDDEEEEEEAPLPPLSWFIVALIYLGGSLLCLLFGVLHYLEVSDSIKGIWLIFALFPFCLMYSIAMWRSQRKAAALEGEAKKND